jgi:hypothetical protein
LIEMKNVNLKLLLQHGVSACWHPETGFLVLSFRRPRVRDIFRNLCCFINTKIPDGKIRQRRKRPRRIKDLIVNPFDDSGNLTLNLDIAVGKNFIPCALTVFLPKFRRNASAGKVKKTREASCFVIDL